ncbi:MAG: hypothetical protein ACKOEX_11000 [Planctomycetia bacterium]
MRRTLSAAVRGTVRAATAGIVLSAVILGIADRSAFAIEMFTYFGDGSRIGLPSLEVPIEAYPGIPLRSDRIRARRRAMQNPGAPVRVGPPGGITIRAMPPGQSIPAPSASR